MQRQNISELDVFRYYIKLLLKMRDLGQDDIRQIKQCLELCHIIFSICEVQKRLIVENDNEELSSKWSDIRIWHALLPAGPWWHKRRLQVHDRRENEMPQELQLLSLTDNKLQEVEKAEAIEWLVAVEERTNCDISDDKLLVINFCQGGAP